ncbi:MAG: hypothetical protein CMK08_03085 [Ponticaulis sp.]|jgi:hypothetical protein|nr:hypothetical protein [Ponticaulis sp.]
MKTHMLICAGITLIFCGSAAAQNASAISPDESSYLTPNSWTRNFTLSDTTPSPSDPVPSVTLQERSQDFQIIGTSRWAMNLNVTTRSEDSPLPREEYRAGATYQFTPRFSFGGSVSVGADELDDVSRWQEQEVEAGVRLETTFRF